MAMGNNNESGSRYLEATDIRRYSLQEIDEAARNYQLAASRGELNGLEAIFETTAFRFRDVDGKFWLVDPRHLQWYRKNDLGWEMSGVPEEPLEGDAGLFWAPSRSAQEIERLMQEVFGEDEEFIGDAPATLKSMILTLKTAYERGLLSSFDVDEIAADRLIVDRTGKPWMVGLSSLEWYRFEEGSWQLPGSTPKVDQIVPIISWPEECENCGQKLREDLICPECDHIQSLDIEFENDLAGTAFQSYVLLGLGTLPESVTEPWDPPATLPDLPLLSGPRCRTCGTINPVDSVYCNKCSAALGCPQCGAINRLQDRFCTQCGTELPALQFEHKS